MPGASPRNSCLSTQLTPHQHFVLLSSEHELATWEKYVEVGRVMCYVLGSVLFLIGSILFYPDYVVMWNGNAGVFASWLFLDGCILYFVGANFDFMQTVRRNHGTQFRQVLRAFNALFVYMASSIFILGALYFLPSWYPKAPELGCWLFIFGCGIFCVTTMVEIFFVCTTHENPEMTDFKIENILCWTSVMAATMFIGAVLFIIGSWYYLPHYINLIDDGTYYMNKAMTLYVIGSLFFIISALAMIPDVYHAVKAGTHKLDIDNKA